ncbi:MAG: MFS transporter [Myxococcota bacterium]|nr:MFS transporter [Myxococcota bacterium]
MKSAPRAPGTTRKLFALSLSIALAMSGVGIIIPVVPSHIGRLGLASASIEQVALHVSLLAASYAFMHLLLAPLWGRLSDSLGRQPLLAIGLVGFAVGQALCGLATSLLTLYAIRLGTGIFSAAIIPAAFAFVADTTSDEDRTRGMAQLSAAAGIGFVIGPAIGGLLGGIEPSVIGLPIADYSLPFFAAAACALLALLALRWLEEPRIPAAAQRPDRLAWTELARQIRLPLAVAMAGQVAVALFETTFVLHARTDLGMGLVEIGVVFMVCGLMMLIVQLGAVSRLARRFGEVHLASAALGLMGTSLALLALARGTATVFALVAAYGIGMGLLAPAVSALVSKRGDAHAGAALGLESGAKSLGQIAGPVLGGVLFGASVAVPFWLASGLLLGLAPIFAWSGRRTHEPPSGRAAKAKLAFGSQEAR